MLASVPLRAVPIGVRAAATIAAREVVVAMCLPKSSKSTGCLPDERGQSIPLNRYRYAARRRREQSVKVIRSVDDALATIGEELGVSRWVEIDQSRIDAFADVTMDHQWIHVDVEKAKAESPYGATIAHGFLTLSLIPGVSKDNYRVENAKMGINYGLNKVRFLSAVTAGSRVRVRSQLADAAKVADDTVNLTVRHTVEIDGVDKPAAVAELIARFIW
jgi:acyl dehydratase